jgi:hypothetical protein
MVEKWVGQTDVTDKENNVHKGGQGGSMHT